MSKEDISATVGQITEGMTHEQRLFHHGIASMNDQPSFMQFWLLQKINLIEVQNDLAKLRGKIFNERAVSSQTAKDLKMLMHDYGQLFCLINVRVLTLLLRSFWVCLALSTDFRSRCNPRLQRALHPF